MERVTYHSRFVYMRYNCFEKYGGRRHGHGELFRSNCRLQSWMFELWGCFCGNVRTVGYFFGICARKWAYSAGHTEKSAKRMDHELFCFEFGLIKLDGTVHVYSLDHDLDRAWIVAV